MENQNDRLGVGEQIAGPSSAGPSTAGPSSILPTYTFYQFLKLKNKDNEISTDEDSEETTKKALLDVEKLRRA